MFGLSPTIIRIGSGLAALVIVLAILMINLTGPKTTSGPADHVLAISWQPGFCETASDKPECKSQTTSRFDATNFSLHGLWPQPGTNIYCGVGDNAIAIDKAGRWRDLEMDRIRDEIWRDLQQVMPGTRSHLHKHEWVKHGTCTGVDVNAYYARSIALMAELNASPLQAFFAGSIGKTVTARAIRKALNQGFGLGAGERLRVSCKRDQDSGRQLIVELTLGLANPFDGEASLADLIMAAPPTDAGCPQGIIDAAGFQ